MANLPFLFPLFPCDGNTKRDKNKQNNTYIGITLIKAFLWTGLMNTGIKYSIKVLVLVLVYKHTQCLSQLMTPAIGVTFFFNQILTFVSLCGFSYIHIIRLKKKNDFCGR